MNFWSSEFLSERPRTDWVRLRTLVFLRWFAIAGQVAALMAATLVFELRFNTGLASIAIGAAVVANLISAFVAPWNKRLSEPEAVLMLLFDLLQLALLLFVTGGLNNPFAILALVPVTIAATFLHIRSALLIAIVSMLVLTLLAAYHLPMRTAAGDDIALPNLLLFGFWAALMIGIAFLGVYARQITSEMHSMGDALLATQMALAREQKLTDLGGVVAAAAHELGTPLATIKLVSSEMAAELKDDPDLLEDITLIAEQTDRCRDILRSMGRAGKDDTHLHRAPLEAVVTEAAEPHRQRGKTVDFTIAPDVDHPMRQPIILRRPEIIHGLRNLIQNAVDFAKSRVVIESAWSATEVSLRIMDDGRGFPASVIGRIGDPFVRRRRSDDDEITRPGYEGMGLGLFIAKTLLERSGATLQFGNGGARAMGQTEDAGAIVTVIWNRDDVDPERDPGLGPVGPNVRFDA